jgi:hypothetical protein
MRLVPFHIVEREIAERETRVIMNVHAEDGVPAGTYGLSEAYCPDPECDCRRVMLNVVHTEQPHRGFLASISYGFDREDEMAGPFLDELSPQSEDAEALLNLVTDTVLSNPGDVERLEEHYRLVKQAASDPGHPAFEELRRMAAMGDDEGPVRTASPRIPRNAPCPCGSGRKYKHCCLRENR